MIVHMPNINSSTIVSVFSDVDSNVNFPTGSIPCERAVAFDVIVWIWELLSFVVALFVRSEMLSSMSITSFAPPFIRARDAVCCSVSRFFSLCFSHSNGKSKPEQKHIHKKKNMYDKNRMKQSKNEKQYNWYKKYVKALLCRSLLMW